MSLIEVMIAAVIFLAGVGGVVAMLTNAATRRTDAGKRAAAGQVAYAFFSTLAARGYDGLPVQGPTNQLVTDATGRQYFVSFQVWECTDPAAPQNRIGVNALPATQPCCAGNTCCRVLQVRTRRDGVNAPFINNSTREVLDDAFVGYVTRGCPP
jgi:Tfp pilus assembly protein PilV